MVRSGSATTNKDDQQEGQDPVIDSGAQNVGSHDVLRVSGAGAEAGRPEVAIPGRVLTLGRKAVRVKKPTLTAYGVSWNGDESGTAERPNPRGSPIVAPRRERPESRRGRPAVLARGLNRRFVEEGA